jgi:hypothetical protein
MIARPERNCDESARIADRQPRRKPDLDRLAACVMRAAQACRQGCGVVRNDQVARSEQPRQFGARQVPHAAVRGDG